MATAATAPAARSFASFLRWNRSESKGATIAPVTSEGADSEPGSETAGAQPVEAAETPPTPVHDESTVPIADGKDATQEGVAAVPVEAAAAADSSPVAAAGSAEVRAPVQEMGETGSVQLLANIEDMAGIDTAEAPEAAPSIDAPPPAPVPYSSLEESTTPSFTIDPRTSATALRTAAWQWAALVVLTLALLLQVVLADRERLAADAQWRPLLTSLCSAFGCTLPAWHEPDAFTMLSRDVRPAPDTEGALLVQATFRNDARWSQQWPVMRLALSDADGRVVGARAFVASEYRGPTVAQDMLAPRQSAQVMLQVREPAASVVAFAFEFD